MLFSSAELFKKPNSVANSVDPDQTAQEQSVLGSRCFASILDSSVMLGNYLQQTT